MLRVFLIPYIAYNAQHVVTQYIASDIRKVRFAQTKTCYWCPVNFSGRNRSVGPISHQPRATPWVG